MAIKKTKRQVEKGRVYITATFNNTLITITDFGGNTLCWGSAGSAGFKGTRRSTPYAAIQAMDQVVRKARETGLKSVEVYIKGPGVGREAALKALRSGGLQVLQIADVTALPHNGPRPKKRRRV